MDVAISEDAAVGSEGSQLFCTCGRGIIIRRSMQDLVGCRHSKFVPAAVLPFIPIECGCTAVHLHALLGTLQRRLSQDSWASLGVLLPIPISAATRFPSRFPKLQLMGQAAVERLDVRAV